MHWGVTLVLCALLSLSQGAPYFEDHKNASEIGQDINSISLPIVNLLGSIKDLFPNESDSSQVNSNNNTSGLNSTDGPGIFYIGSSITIQCGNDTEADGGSSCNKTESRYSGWIPFSLNGTTINSLNNTDTITTSTTERL